MISVDGISWCDGGRTGFISGPWSADKTRSQWTGAIETTLYFQNSDGQTERSGWLGLCWGDVWMGEKINIFMATAFLK